MHTAYKIENHVVEENWIRQAMTLSLCNMCATFINIQRPLNNTKGRGRLFYTCMHTGTKPTTLLIQSFHTKTIKKYVIQSWPLYCEADNNALTISYSWGCKCWTIAVLMWFLLGRSKRGHWVCLLKGQAPHKVMDDPCTTPACAQDFQGLTVSYKIKHSWKQAMFCWSLQVVWLVNWHTTPCKPTEQRWNTRTPP